jgi:nicotinamidase-related amidase
MSLKIYALILLAVIAAFALSAVVMLIRSMFVATKGRKIATYPDPHKALVVLDLQEGYAGTNTRQPVTIPPATGMISTVNRLIDHAAASGMEIAYFRQVFGNNLIVRLHGGRKRGKVIIDRRIKVINDNDFEKNRTDAFSNRQFEQLLIDRHVDELYLVGVDAAYCVYYTALGALNRGYKVAVVTDAVASRNTMAGVLERYRRKGIAVITSEKLIKERQSDLTRAN